MITKPGLGVVVTVFCLLLSPPVIAAWYQVEIIVFDQLSPDFDGELWYENPGLPDRTNSIELIADVADDESQGINESGKQEIQIPHNKAELLPFLQLPEKQLRLDGIQRVLKLSREYRPVIHVAWQQPGLNAASARAVHIQKFEEPGEFIYEDETENEPYDLHSIANTGDGSEDIYQVLDLIFDGTVRLRSSKFLHVDIDIAYFPEFLNSQNNSASTDNALFVQQQADYVRLQESRKIKLNEIHYFDHPIFGVILRVSRLKLN